MSRQNSWTDIPPEIVDQILGYCDRPSLLVLGRVNHQLNFRALAQYFAQQIMGDVIQLPPKRFSSENRFLEYSFGTSDEPIHALRTALWLPRIVQHINYCPEHDAKYDHYVHDLCDLTTFIHRMQKLVSLRIHSGLIEYGGTVNERSHSDVWDRLFEAVILKGCEILEVKEEGIDIRDGFSLPLGPSISPRASILRPETWLFDIFDWASTPEQTIGSPDPTSLFSPQSASTVRPTLREVQIYGSSIPPLTPPTVLTSITRLSLKDMDVWDQNKLKEYFDCIYFYLLESFTFSSHWPPSPTIFLTFLSRHQTLVDLDLDVRLPNRQIWPLKIWSSWRRPLILPNLQNLRMLPEAFQWFERDLRQCPKLRSITLKDDRRSVGDNLSPCRLQDVIKCVLDNLHSSPSMTWPLEVEIKLPLGDPHWVSKLCPVATHPGWSRVKVLKLEDTRHSVNPIPSILVNWLSTFPSLECLEISSLMKVPRKKNLLSHSQRGVRDLGLWKLHITIYTPVTWINGGLFRMEELEVNLFTALDNSIKVTVTVAHSHSLIHR